MAEIIRMPSVLAGATEAAISKWLVQIGDQVNVGDPLAELETEKAVVEYNAEISGKVGRFVLAEGVSGEIGVPIAVFVAEGETDADVDAVLGSEAGANAPNSADAQPVDVIPQSAAPTAAAPAQPAPVPVPVAAEVSTVSAPAVPGERIFASPLARKMAKERGIDLTVLQGTGPGGRIVRSDVEAVAAQSAMQPATAQHSAASLTAPSVTESIPLTPMRKAIARRLTESKTTVPHFYLTTECHVDALLKLREDINAVSPQRVSVNDLVVKAAAMAFVDVPEANVTWGETELIKHGSVDISVAVSTEGGLLTPVVRDITSKSVSAISAEIKDLVARAQAKKLRQDELEGGSFSISNLGMYGTLEFAAILNPPQSGILAVGAAVEQPIVKDGQLTVGKVMRCTLSADHRAVDGALAAQWLAAFTARIESPISLLV